MCDTPPDYSPRDATPLAPVADPPTASPTAVHSSPRTRPLQPRRGSSARNPGPASLLLRKRLPWDVHASGQGPELPDLAANVHPMSYREYWPPQAAEPFLVACVHGVAMHARHWNTTLRRPATGKQWLRTHLDSARAASPEARQELPDRHAHWAPVHQVGDNVWTEWICLRLQHGQIRKKQLMGCSTCCKTFPTDLCAPTMDRDCLR